VVVPGDVPGVLSCDAAAAECLLVWPPPNANDKDCDEPSTCLYSLVPVKTAAGRRVLSVRLQQPSTDLSVLTARHDALDVLLSQWATCQSIQQQLSLFASHDLLALASRLEAFAPDSGTKGAAGGTRKALQALYQLYMVASQKLPCLVEAFQQLDVVNQMDSQPERGGSSDAGLLRTLYEKCNEASSNLQRSVDLAEAVIDLDQAPREFLVRSSYMPELNEIQVELQQVQYWLCVSNDYSDFLIWIGPPPSLVTHDAKRTHVSL